MKNKLRLNVQVLAGVCFFIAALLNKNYVFIPLGLCFIYLGFRNGSRRNMNKNEDK